MEMNETSNASANASHELELDVMDQLSTKVAFATVYCLIFVFGICGNAMVIAAVLSTRRMYTVTNILILNLAVSDINVTIVSVVFTPLATFMNTWLFGETWCKLVGMLSCASIYASSLTSTVIAIDRYLVVVHPLRPRMNFRVLVSIILAIWCFSTGIAMPIAVYNSTQRHDDVNIVVCVEQWPSTKAKQLFSIGSFILQFIVPLSIIAFCYSRTWIALANRLKNRNRWSTANEEREEREIRRRRRMTRMLTAMVSLYATCWMIFNLYTIIDDQVKISRYFDYEPVTFQIVHTIAVSSVVYNPLLYGWMNDNFRKQFYRMCMSLFVCKRTRRATVSGTAQHSKLFRDEVSVCPAIETKGFEAVPAYSSSNQPSPRQNDSKKQSRNVSKNNKNFADVDLRRDSLEDTNVLGAESVIVS